MNPMNIRVNLGFSEVAYTLFQKNNTIFRDFADKAFSRQYQNDYSRKRKVIRE